MKITDVYVMRLSGAYHGGADLCPDNCVVSATDQYPDFRRHAAASRVVVTPEQTSDGALLLTQDFLRIDTDAGVSGVVGPITFPGITYYLLHHIKYTLLGQDPMRIDYLWDIMYRLGMDQAAGDLTRAMSHAEAALWDIKAKHLGIPLYELLGGKVRASAPAYLNTVGLPHTREGLLPVVQQYTQDGVPGVKIYSKYGPAQGKDGIHRTCETLEQVREAIGPTPFIALEGVCCFDYRYTMQLADAIRHVDIAWIEEPCMVHAMGEYARLKQNCPIPVSAGEHSATRWEFRQMLELDAADLYQPEAMWDGGIGETMRILHLLSAFHKKAYLHSCIPAVCAHILAATSPSVVPMTEYLLTVNTAAQYFLKAPVMLKNGQIAPGEAPGIGCDIDYTKVESKTILS